MTTERLYDIIKAWHDSCDAAGLYLVAKDMNTTLKQLEADMVIEQSKKSGTKSIVTAANRISPIYFKAENGDGVVCPVNHK